MCSFNPVGFPPSLPGATHLGSSATGDLWDGLNPCSHPTDKPDPSSQAVGRGGNHRTSAGTGPLVAVTEHKQSFGFLQWRHLIKPDPAEGNTQSFAHVVLEEILKLCCLWMLYLYEIREISRHLIDGVADGTGA